MHDNYVHHLLQETYKWKLTAMEQGPNSNDLKVEEQGETMVRGYGHPVRFPIWKLPTY